MNKTQISTTILFKKSGDLFFCLFCAQIFSQFTSTPTRCLHTNIYKYIQILATLLCLHAYVDVAMCMHTYICACLHVYIDTCVLVFVPYTQIYASTNTNQEPYLKVGSQPNWRNQKHLWEIAVTHVGESKTPFQIWYQPKLENQKILSRNC